MKKGACNTKNKSPNIYQLDKQNPPLGICYLGLKCFDDAQPWEDIEVAVQTGELDGIAWSGITEDYTVGWADVTNYFLTNNISGAWCGSFFANEDRWNELPEHLKTLWTLCMDSSHYYRQHWYWGGEAKLRTQGTKMELTSIPDAEWKTVEDEALKFWDEIAEESPRSKKVVDIFKAYNKTLNAAGTPYV